jgi:O-antigen/teichoic acid export membrane protein
MSVATNSTDPLSDQGPAGDRPLEHRAARVSLVTGMSTLLTLIFQLTSVPICLRYWGEQTYGSWLALYSAYMLIRALDGGYTAFVGNKLNYLYHTSVSAVRRHLSSAVFGILAISCLQMVLVAVALFADPLSHSLGLEGGEVRTKVGLAILMSSWVLSGPYLGIVHRLQIPSGLMYQAAWWAMEFQVSQFAALMFAAALRLDMLETSLLFAASQAASYVASALYVRYKLPQFSPWLAGADWRVGLRDLGQSTFITASNLIQQGGTNGAVLLISIFAGPTAVPLFTTVRTLTNLWTTVTTVLSAPLLPDVVRLHALGEVKKLIAINRAYWVLVGTAVNLGALLTYPLIPFLYGLWTRHAVGLDTPLLCLLLASTVVANAGSLMALHLNGVNSLRIVLAAAVVRAAFALGGGALGFKVFGLASFGLGILVGETIATLMTGRYFITHEITARGGRIAASDFAAISVSTGAVLTFFLGAASGLWSSGGAWLLSLFAVAAAFIWGWSTLEKEVQMRLRSLITRAIRRRSAAAA